MTFPQTPLPLQVDISLDGSTWTEITPDVLGEQQIRITRGRTDWGQHVDYGRCQLTLKNPDGRYSPRNPLSPYYGKIGRNTPLRVSVKTGSVALDLPGNPGDYASTPDTAALDITGDIDIRVDATLLNWVQPDYPSAGQTVFPRTELIAKRAAGQVSWALYTTGGRPYLEWSPDGTNTRWAWSDVDLPLTTSGRIAVRATLDVDNGAGGCFVAFYYADTIAGPWTLLDSGALSNTTSIYSGTAPLKIGDATELTVWKPALGRVHAAQVYSGINGTLVASPDFTAQPSGTASFTDSAGRVWSLAGDAQISNRKVRFVGEIASWTPRWETGGTNVVTEIEAAGVLRRLGTGASVPAKSPVYREFTSPGRMATGIVAYWPMEDGATATRLASGYAGHPAGQISGAVTPAAYSAWPASAPLPTLTSGSIKVSVPPYPANQLNYNSIGFFCMVPAAGVGAKQRLVSFSAGGSASLWSIYVDTSGLLSMKVWDTDGNILQDTGTMLTSINGRQVYIILSYNASIPDVFWTLTIVDITQSMSTAVPNNSSVMENVQGSFTSATVRQITQVRFGEDGLMNGTAIGHLAIGSSANAFAASAGALVAWNAEEASSRASRLGLEEGIHSYATSGGDEQCGTQPSGTVLAIMQSAEDVDEGILAEQRRVLGLRYVTRASMYNQPPALVLDYTGNDGLVMPLEPVEDDQSSTNDITVSRTDGASARLTQDTGPLSTLPPPAGIGSYDSSYTLNLLDDSRPLQHAGWRLHIGTWDELRFPVVTVNLAKAPGKIEQASAVDVGSRLQILNPPGWLPPDTIDLQVQGYTEVLDQFTWTISFNCAPAGPFDVAWTGSATTASKAREFQWADTTGSQLAAALTATDTTATVLTTASPIWTPNVADTPFDWRVGGEVMTVTAPGNLQVGNPFFDTSVIGWSGASATVAHSTAVVHPHPRAKGSMLVTPAGGVSAVSGRSDLTAVGSIVPGQQYKVSGWFYSPKGWSALSPSAQWTDASGAVISSTVSSQAVPAGQWTYLESLVTAPSGASRVRVAARADGTPSASDIYYAWAVRITRVKSSALYDTFSRTASSSWGLADSGQSWTQSGGSATDYNVTSGYGSQVHSTIGVRRICTTPAPGADLDLYADITTSATATGGSLYAAVAARYTDVNNQYFARIEFTTSNAISLTIRERVAGTETQLAAYTVPFAHVPGTFVRVRFQCIGSTLSAKIWQPTSIEPSVWHLQVTDTTFTQAGSLALWSTTAAGTTTVNAEARFKNYDLINPQVYCVTRSQNRVVKAQPAGADVRLATPSTVAL